MDGNGSPGTAAVSDDAGLWSFDAFSRGELSPTAERSRTCSMPSAIFWCRPLWLVRDQIRCQRYPRRRCFQHTTPAEVDQLEAKVQALKLSSRRPIRLLADAAAKKVAADADSQGKLLDATTTNAGWDQANGFHIGSDDGNFYLHPWTLFQFDGVMNYRPASPLPIRVKSVRKAPCCRPV